ncbi:SDR family NAD(P)-dependent oxidoreductase [Kitasatospora purpeofusca]|uniref:SDR family NAD(P)-dependent oxidoreductase n=1 Tax=Kitasatospora purpeofusca TaxID=67352 RepID=UPI003667012C
MSASDVEPIAIVGIACRFPGGVQSAAGLWQLSADGRQTVGAVPRDRWDAARLAALHSPELAERAGRGCFLEGDMWAWDPQAFSVAPMEQRWVDPQFRVLMEVAWEAVEHAGIPTDRMRGSRTGVYVGTYAPDNLFREARPVEDAPNSPYLFGNFTAGAAGRVAFAMDLRGPVMVISTHCSSGLVALDTACGALTLGECDTALAGGVLLMLSPETHYYEAPLLLSQRGACHSFDSRADGYVRGEGAGVLVLKRLADARRAGDRVLAVIRGSAVNNDGQASRLTAPSTQMQQRLFREAVEKAGIDPGEVGLVEAHGPGTAVGDPIEYTSINAVYGQGAGRCALGSVKTNIGHSEPVSGIAGMIKAVECLRRGVIPPNLNFEHWNPTIRRKGESRLFVPTELTQWPVPGTGGRLAAVCSYGVTGTNSHVVLESAPQTGRRRPAKRVRQPDRQAQVFLLSAGSPQSLSLAAVGLTAWTEGDGAVVSLLDVAHTLALRRRHADHRLAVVARDRGELATRLRSFAAGEAPDGVVGGVPVLAPEHSGPVFVFTGQGSQRAGMCRELLAGDQVFAAAIAELEPLISAEAGFSLTEMIAEPERLVGIDRIQPTLFGIQVALAALWRSWGVEPAAVIGQSLGEVAAAVVVGLLSPAEGVQVICRRSALLATISGGAMASVMLDAERVRAAIEDAGADGVSIGVLTSPQATVVSGDAAQVPTLVDAWTAEGTVARMIDVDVASHSRQVDPVLEELYAALADIPAVEPNGRFFSTVSSDPLAPGPLDAAYWVRNQRDTVRFHTAVSSALTAGHRLFIECTPHPLAVRPILEAARAQGVADVVAVGTLRQGTADHDAFLTHLGAVHCAGYDGIRFDKHYGHGRLADLPVTQWHRTRHGGDQTPYRLVAPELPGATQHALLGGHVADPDSDGSHLWQSPLGSRLIPWLADHRVADTPVLPGTAMVEMMLAAAAQVFETDHVSARDIVMMRPLLLEPEPIVTTRLSCDGHNAHVEIVSGHGETTITHARGTVGPTTAQQRPARAAGPERDPKGWQDYEPATLHRTFRDKHNVFHGPAFTALERIQVHPTEDRVVSTPGIHESAQVSASAMRLHPALADEVVQTMVAAWLSHYTLTPGPVVVAGFEEVAVYGPTTHTRQAVVHLDTADDLGCVGAARLITADGTVTAEFRGLRVANVTPPAERFTSRLSHLDQVSAPAPRERTRATDSTWTLISATGGTWSRDLARELENHSCSCRLLTMAEALSDGSTAPAGTAVLLTIGEDESEDDSADAARNLVSRAVALLHALSRCERPPRLWVVTRTDGPRLPATALRGLLRVAAYEHPELSASFMEFTPRTAPARVVAELLDTSQAISEILLDDDARTLAQVRTGPDTPAATTPRPPVRKGGSYLVTGALGGLGLLSVQWLAQRGAGRIVLSGRSAPAAATRERLAGLRELGADLIVVTGDIADPAVTARAVAASVEDGRQLRGVLHAAGVVEDATLANIDDPLLDRVWRGKAAGAWSLHRATLGMHLDFFTVYSSLASLVGSPGQGAYAAANAYLDGLVSWRQDHGLPATAIHWGAWSEVGRGQHLAQRGFLTITPADGIDALERILTSGYRQVAYSPVDMGRWTAPYPAVRASALLAPLLAGEETPDDTAAVREALLTAAGPAERQELLQAFVIDCVRELLGATTRHIGAHTSMILLGLDSLGAVQLQLRLQRALRTEMKPGVIWVKPSAASLSEWLLEHLGFHTDEEADEVESDGVH